MLTRASLYVKDSVASDGRIDTELLERHQHAAHGLSWLATYIYAIRELVAYSVRMADEGRFGETEELLTRIVVGEYLAQIAGGIPMNQSEFIRPTDFGIDPSEWIKFWDENVQLVVSSGNTPLNRARLVELMCAGSGLATVLVIEASPFSWQRSPEERTKICFQSLD